MWIPVEASCVCWATPAIAAISIVRAAILVIHIAEVVIFLVQIHANSDELGVSGT